MFTASAHLAKKKIFFSLACNLLVHHQYLHLHTIKRWKLLVDTNVCGKVNTFCVVIVNCMIISIHMQYIESVTVINLIRENPNKNLLECE